VVLVSAREQRQILPARRAGDAAAREGARGSRGMSSAFSSEGAVSARQAEPCKASRSRSIHGFNRMANLASMRYINVDITRDAGTAMRLARGWDAGAAREG
jgi:hypothetical protein